MNLFRRKPRELPPQAVAEPPSVAPTPASFQQRVDMATALGKRGVRMTPQRLMIVAAIDGSADHITAEEIYGQVVQKYPNVNISTVYRTLDKLEELALVTKTDLGGGRVRYHPAHKGNHHHLVCRQCGAIIDLDETAFVTLRQALQERYGFTAELKHMGIWGRCSRCRLPMQT